MSKPQPTSWSPLQLRSDAREALNDIRDKDYPEANSYSDVILELIEEHKNNKIKL